MLSPASTLELRPGSLLPSASGDGGQSAGTGSWCHLDRACPAAGTRVSAAQAGFAACLALLDLNQEQVPGAAVPAPKPYLNRAPSHTQTALPAPPAPSAALGAALAELIFSPHPAPCEQLPWQRGMAGRPSPCCAGHRHVAGGGDASDSCCRVSPFPLCTRPSVPTPAHGLSGCKLELVQILGQVAVAWGWAELPATTGALGRLCMGSLAG